VAVAGTAPFTWTKQIAANYGEPATEWWPLAQRIKARVDPIAKWHHVIDVAPTILEAAGLPEPKRERDGPDAHRRREHGLHVDDAKAKDRHITQYFEIFGNRAMYHDGWLAGTVHRAPWEQNAGRAQGRT